MCVSSIVDDVREHAVSLPIICESFSLLFLGVRSNNCQTGFELSFVNITTLVLAKKENVL